MLMDGSDYGLVILVIDRFSPWSGHQKCFKSMYVSFIVGPYHEASKFYSRCRWPGLLDCGFVSMKPEFRTLGVLPWWGSGSGMSS